MERFHKPSGAERIRLTFLDPAEELAPQAFTRASEVQPEFTLRPQPLKPLACPPGWRPPSVAQRMVDAQSASQAAAQPRTRAGPVVPVVPHNTRKRKPSLADGFLQSANPDFGHLLEQARLETMAVRDAGSAASTSGLQSAVTGMKPDEYARLAGQAVSLRALNDKRLSALRTYEAYFRSHGQAAPMPIKAMDVIAYIGNAVIVRENMSHKAMDKVSDLRVAARALGAWAVDRDGEEAIRAHITHLCEVLPSEPEHGEAAPLDAVAAACKRLAADGSLDALQTRAQMSISVGGHLRGVELTHKSDREHTGLRFDDVVTLELGLGIKARLSKTKKQSLRPSNRACPHLPLKWAEICPAKCFGDYDRALRATGWTPKPLDSLWPVLDYGLDGPVVVGGAMRGDVVQKRLMAELAKEGADTSVLNVHWGRNTGCALFADVIRIDKLVAEQIGGWSNKDVVKSFKRRTMAKHYNTKDTPIPELLQLGKDAVDQRAVKTCCSAVTKE